MREPQPIREPHELPGASLRHPAEHLTDNYRKDEDSNNYKLLDLDHAENKKIWRILALIEAWRDMDDAEGFTLDKIGKNVLELREGRSDTEYRKAIKIKIRGNLSAGTIEDLNAVAAVLFGDSFISVSETWYQADYNYEPAAVAVSVSSFPNQRDIEFLSDIVKAGGVGMYSRLPFMIRGSIGLAATLNTTKHYTITQDFHAKITPTANLSLTTSVIQITHYQIKNGA